MSGGGATVEEQRAHGADLSKDMAYQYLEIFMEDDQKLAEIREAYSTGKMLTGEVKAALIEIVQVWELFCEVYALRVLLRSIRTIEPRLQMNC